MIGDIRKFRFWCQKVLPLVYDDSLSYYEVLCKVVTYLNNVIADVNTIPEYIDGVIDEKLSDEHLQELIEQFVLNIESAISSNNEGDNTNSSADYNIGQMLWWNGKLYKVIRQIDAGDTFIVNTNIELVNFEDLFNNFLTEIKDNFTSNDDGGSPTATQSWTAGTWLWLNDVLYIVTRDITEGNAYVFTGDNANVQQISVEGEINKEATARENADATLQNNIDAEANARESADENLGDSLKNYIDGLTGDLDNLSTEAKDNLVAAINEINATGGGSIEMIGDLADLLTDYKTNLVGAINEVDLLAKAGGTGYANVKNYGAVGDGVTDDTQAFLDALDEADGIYVPTGKYLITQPLNLAKKKRVFLGDGASNTILIDGITTADHTFISVDNSDVPDDDPHFLTDLDIGRFGILGNADCAVGFHVNGTAHCMYHDIICTNLDKTDAKAFKICSLICSYKNLKVHFMDVDAYEGHEADYGVYIDLCTRVGGLASIPAVNNAFYDCYFTMSKKYGIYINHGSVNKFYSCVAESNANRNVYIGAGDATYKTNMNIFIGCAFEDAPMNVEDYGTDSVYIATYFNTYPHTDITSNVTAYIRGANAKYFGCKFMYTPVLFGYGSSSTLIACTMDVAYRNAGDMNVLLYNSHYSDGSLVTIDAGYFSIGTFSAGTYTARNYFKDILIVNVIGHNVSTDTITITSGGTTSTTRGSTFILYPGDTVTITTSNANVVGTARHMSTN